MKKWLPCLALLFLVFVTFSCQKPEEVTLSKYFNAMKIKDVSTTSAMALEPFSVEYKSWKVISIDEPVVENYGLPEMDKAMNDMKKASQEQLRVVQDKRDERDTLKGDLSEARGKKKAELQKKVDAAEEAHKLETEKYLQMQTENTKKKAEIETEKTLIRLSNGLEKDLETFEGKTITTKVHVSIATNSGDKEYIFVLRRYELNNPKTNKPFYNKNVIQKITTKEELEK